MIYTIILNISKAEQKADIFQTVFQMKFLENMFDQIQRSWFLRVYFAKD